MIPPAGFNSLSTSSRMVIAAVCQPLAANPPKIEPRAASSSRWKGCGSNSAAKVLIRSFSTRRRPEPNVCPAAKSSRYRSVIAAGSRVDPRRRGSSVPPRYVSRLPLQAATCATAPERLEEVPVLEEQPSATRTDKARHSDSGPGNCGHPGERDNEYRCVLEEQVVIRSEEHTSELQSLRTISYAVFC